MQKYLIAGLSAEERKAIERSREISEVPSVTFDEMWKIAGSRDIDALTKMTDRIFKESLEEEINNPISPNHPYWRSSRLVKNIFEMFAHTESRDEMKDGAFLAVLYQKEREAYCAFNRFRKKRLNMPLEPKKGLNLIDNIYQLLNNGHAKGALTWLRLYWRGFCEDSMSPEAHCSYYSGENNIRDTLQGIWPYFKEKANGKIFSQAMKHLVDVAQEILKREGKPEIHNSLLPQYKKAHEISHGNNRVRS